MIEIFLIGLLNVLSLLLLWFISPLKITLSKIIFKRELMHDSFDDLLYSKNKFLGELLTCWICCSFWLSLLVGIVYMFVLNLTPWWPIITFLSYPILCYVFNVFFKR
jgi:hypothetical protein